MKIGIDIDNCIVDTRSVVKDFIKQNNLEDLYYNDTNAFYTEYGKDIYPLVQFKNGVKEAFEWMKENNIKIIIITAREYVSNCDVEVMCINLFIDNNMPYDKIIINSKPKGPDAAKEKIDLFIDDLERNLDSVSDYDIDCIQVTNSLENNSKYPQFTNWHDILDYIKGWMKKSNKV